jgi:hypothetical protein
MQKHNTENRHILEHIPSHRLIMIDPVHNLEVRNNEPTPVEIDLDSRDSEQRERTGSDSVHNKVVG